jgi:hypothetical protein
MPTASDVDRTQGPATEPPDIPPAPGQLARCSRGGAPTSLGRQCITSGWGAEHAQQFIRRLVACTIVVGRDRQRAVAPSELGKRSLGVAMGIVCDSDLEGVGVRETVRARGVANYSFVQNSLLLFREAESRPL